MKTEVYRQILVLIINNQILIDIVKFKFFLFSKPKVFYLRPLLTFILFAKILKTEFYVFWTQTYRNLKSIKNFNSLHVLYALENVIA